MLQDAKLQGARLWGANLEGADLSSADLREADLIDDRGFSMWTKFRVATRGVKKLKKFLAEAEKLRQLHILANLEKANLQGAKVTPEQLAKDANLRAGPGTNYAIIAAAKAGDTVDLLGRNEAGDWLLVGSAGGSAWIATFLVDISDADISDLPIKQSDAPTVTPVPQQTPSPITFPQIGEEVEGGGWRFKVSEVHKRKAVYFYSRSYIAHGSFLVVIIDAVNLQSGTDYFHRNMRPWVVNLGTTVYRYSSKATSYAEWQFGGLDSIFTDVNPGNSARMTMVFDIPEGEGRVLLSTDALIWIDLGDFSAMPLEE